MESIPASIRVRVRAIADSASASNAPAEDILNYVRMLTLHGRSAEVVVAAASTRLGLLRTSRVALGSSAGAADVKAGADALRTGRIDSVALGRIAAQKRSASLFSSIGLVTDLVNADVPSDIAEQAVARLAAAGAQDLDLANFRETVVSTIAIGALPAAAVTERVNATVTTDASGVTTLINGPATRPVVPGRLRIPPEEN
jgi:hypothetical protein